MAGQISESDQIKQFKEFFGIIEWAALQPFSAQHGTCGTCNKLTENCFLDCIKGFISREVKPEETTCSDHCLQKYLKMAQRISRRFQDFTTYSRMKLAAEAG
ncbi:TIM9 translocase, partial [Thinocorus orbignyianus]|nr:TIM9 translocase [Thinocorus orbignyianus]